LVITVDLDTTSKQKLLAAYRKALKYGKTRVTQTTKGWHLRIDSPIEDPWEMLNIRYLIGDDPKRIEHDKIFIELGHPELANRLFEWKRPLGSKKYVKEKPYKMEAI
jgi:hypothetical protein